MLVMNVLRPIWCIKMETAVRLRGRIESILDWATVSNCRHGENPARWRGHLENLLGNHESDLRHTIPVLNAGKKRGYDADADWVKLGSCAGRGILARHRRVAGQERAPSQVKSLSTSSAAALKVPWPETLLPQAGKVMALIRR